MSVQVIMDSIDKKLQLMELLLRERELLLRERELEVEVEVEESKPLTDSQRFQNRMIEREQDNVRRISEQNAAHHCLMKYGSNGVLTSPLSARMEARGT